MTTSDRLGLIVAQVLDGLHREGQPEAVLALAQPLLPTEPSAVADDETTLTVTALVASYAAAATYELSRPAETLRYAELQVALGSRLPSPSIVLARGHAWRALALEAEGRFVDAVDDYRAGLSLLADLRDHPAAAEVEGMLRLNFFDLLVTRGDPQGGLIQDLPPASDGEVSLARRSLEASRAVAAGDLAGGLESMRAVHAEALRRGKTRWAGIAASNIGTTLLEAGNPQAAIPHLEEARELLSAPGSGEQQGVACKVLAQAQLQLGRLEPALASLKLAWAAFRRDAPRSVKALPVLWLLGQLRLVQGDFSRARGALQRGLELYESLRPDIGMLEAEQAATMQTYRSIVEVHLYLSVHEGWVDEVQQLIERSKARFWSESLARYHADQRRRSDEPGDDASRFRFHAPAIDRLVCNFFVGPNGSFVIVGAGPRPSVWRIDAGEAQLREMVEDVTFDLLATPSRSAPVPAREAARRLAELIFRDADVLAARSVVLLPDGPLWALPFDALLAEIAGPGVDLPPVSLAPASHVLELIEKRGRAHTPVARWQLLAVGAPSAGDGFVDIPGARDQMQWMRRAFPGSWVFEANEATRENVCTHISGASHVHVAAHAFATPDDDRPFVVLSDGRGGPDRWYAEDIAQLSLRAELVFLSACSTSVGRLSPGEGVASLGRAFLHAGADCIVSTLWPVPDAEAMPLVRYFYEALAAGDPVAVAARHAQRMVREAGGSARMWAGLQIVGDGFAGEDQRAEVLRKGTQSWS